MKSLKDREVSKKNSRKNPLPVRALASTAKSSPVGGLSPPSPLSNNSNSLLNSQSMTSQKTEQIDNISAGQPTCAHCGSPNHVYFVEGSCPIENRTNFMKLVNIPGCVYCGSKEHSYFKPADCPVFVRVKDKSSNSHTCKFCSSNDHTTAECGREKQARDYLKTIVAGVDERIGKLHNLPIAPRKKVVPGLCQFCSLPGHVSKDPDGCPNHQNFQLLRKLNRHGCAYCFSPAHLFTAPEDCPLFQTVDYAFTSTSHSNQCEFCGSPHAIADCDSQKEARHRCAPIFHMNKPAPKCARGDVPDTPKPTAPISKTRKDKSSSTADEALLIALQNEAQQAAGNRDATFEMLLEQAEAEQARIDNARGLQLLCEDDDVPNDTPSVGKAVQKNLDKHKIEIQTKDVCIEESRIHDEFRILCAVALATTKRYFIDVTHDSPPNSLMYPWQDNLLSVGAGVMVGAAAIPLGIAAGFYINKALRFTGGMAWAARIALDLVGLYPRPMSSYNTSKIQSFRTLSSMTYLQRADHIARKTISQIMGYPMRRKLTPPDNPVPHVDRIPYNFQMPIQILCSLLTFVPIAYAATKYIRSLLPLRYRATVRRYEIDEAVKNVPTTDVRADISSLSGITHSDMISMSFTTTDFAVYYRDCTRGLALPERIKAYVATFCGYFMGIQLKSRLPNTPDIPPFIHAWIPRVDCACAENNLDCECGPILRTTSVELGNEKDCKFSYELVAQVLGGRGHDASRTFSEYCEDFRSIAARTHTGNVDKYFNIDDGTVCNSAYFAAVIATHCQKIRKRIFPISVPRT